MLQNTQENLSVRKSELFSREVYCSREVSVNNLKWGDENATDEDIWKAIEIAQAKEVVEGKPGKLDFQLEQ